MVLPGFVATEGFPATELREKAITRWAVTKPEKVAEAIYEAGPGGKAERYVPRPYALAAVARILAPSLVRRVLSGGAAKNLTTSTAAEKDGA
jgi:short-subunit dehydrogenase